MHMKNLAKKVLVAAMMSGAALAANATNTVLGAATIGAPLSFGGYASGPFLDNFLFSLPANGGSGYSVSDFTFLPIQFNTVFSGMTLVSNADGIIGNSDDTIISTVLAPQGGSGNLSLSIGPKPAGNYYLSVFGITNGSQGGIYNGAISVTAVTPVPEPESYAMFLAGLGVMGAIAVRRNKAKKG
jgi:hypothetical protein